MSRVVAPLAAIFTMIVGGAFYVLTVAYYDDPNKLSAIGQVIGAGVSSIGFIWVLVSQYMVLADLRTQARALVNQGEEIAIQRKAIDQNERSIAAEIYLLSLTESQKTLSRLARSVIACGAAHSLAKLDADAQASGDWSVYVSFLADDPSVDAFLAAHRSDPLIAGLSSKYREYYEKLKDIATRSAGGVELFQLTMENSSYQQALSKL